ncbi:prepilin-type N-terminal cleavage/methylation domain-containing protein [Vibrio sp. CAU 1672]|uniref:type IV pilus modification PilV family protein n=1 Tax=Vibrio sp. CAU 1672 TaxID=3032594 RepID=UPI0023DA9F82|nr:prepilin-type N-terminal cleavage/methylation domain-containing protein [Vibrio sp. CAU 1672]MDF2155632.1 prepilin-type N-terminal cleavage/methylation domain-containing protein [Vibrio sp. CAU 1672]
MSKQAGMTLIEMILAIVLMGIAMVGFSAFLVPQISNSAVPHYQTRAAALGQSFMSQILARGFDHWSNFDGGMIRCGEPDPDAHPDNPENNCSATLGVETIYEEVSNDPSTFNDVDDFIGCWSTPTTAAQCPEGTHRGNITDVLGTASVGDYQNFRLEVAVAYDDLAGGTPTAPTAYKKVTVRIFAASTQPLTLSAIKGNY